MGISSRPATRRTLLRSAAVLGAVAVGGLVPLGRAVAGAPSIIKALPVTWFIDFGTNAEMRWDSVRRRDY
ncbi:MAG: hypothetical protein JWN91_1491, partial [Nocardioides sp.]|nr:hypothetical protein [Nocardioides sp.]